MTQRSRLLKTPIYPERAQEPDKWQSESEGFACATPKLAALGPDRVSKCQITGVSDTLKDVNQRKRVSDSPRSSLDVDVLAEISASRRISEISHDLRQPLQTLSLLHGLLLRVIEDDKALHLLERVDAALDSMRMMLNSLLDDSSKALEPFEVRIKPTFIGPILLHLKNLFDSRSEVDGTNIRIVSCNCEVTSDAAILESTLRCVVKHVLEYSSPGRILIGCRRRNGRVRIEVWSSGKKGSFDNDIRDLSEIQNLDNPALKASHELAPHLSTARDLAELLHHDFSELPRRGICSAFGVEVAQVTVLKVSKSFGILPTNESNSSRTAYPKARVLIIEDVTAARSPLVEIISSDGNSASVACDYQDAIKLMSLDKVTPDIVIADLCSQSGVSGIKIIEKIRTSLKTGLPGIILTDDSSMSTLKMISGAQCFRMDKPVNARELSSVIKKIMTKELRQNKDVEKGDSLAPFIYIVDDDVSIRESLANLLDGGPWQVEMFQSCEAFLGQFKSGREACLLIDAYLPGMSGIELLLNLKESGCSLPAIMITGVADVSTAVRAMKAGAIDLLQKPVGQDEILSCVHRALDLARDSSKRRAWHEDAASHVANLTSRQKQVMELVLAGHASKRIAFELGMSQRTVENHRAAIMKRMGVKSLPALARLALAADL